MNELQKYKTGRVISVYFTWTIFINVKNIDKYININLKNVNLLFPPNLSNSSSVHKIK